ncbi:MAG: ferritin-like domain-containing protein, partial [Archangium sp.]
REFQQDHERHIRELSGVVTKLGGKPRSKPDTKGFILKGFTAVTSMMGNEAALQAMRGNEALTNRTYRMARDEDWSDEARIIIERNYSDEQRHLAFIEDALRTRSWEQPTVQP